MAKHIRGPWKFGTLTEFGVRRYTCVYADTPESPGGKTIVIRTGTVRGEAEAASVKLATAAPELLEALVDILGWFNTTEIRHAMTKKGEMSECNRIINLARAAIAKATAE